MSNQNHELKAVRVHIEGRVQGVGFRYFVYKNARRRGVAGWVRNLEDGRVEAHFEGSSEQVHVLIELCKKGPAGAKVKQVDTQPETPSGRGESFDFKYD